MKYDMEPMRTAIASASDMELLGLIVSLRDATKREELNVVRGLIGDALDFLRLDDVILAETVPQERLSIVPDWDYEPDGGELDLRAHGGAWQVLYQHDDGSHETPVGGACRLSVNQAGELLRSGRIVVDRDGYPTVLP